MKTNSRFVVIDPKKKTLDVYEDRRFLVQYVIETPITSEDVEWARTQEYKTKA